MKGMVVEMSNIFIEIVNNSITASYLIVAVIILRMILKKVPKWSVCLLWALVAVRLALPFEIESSYSLVPKKLFQIEKSQNISAFSMEQEETKERLDAYIQNRQELQQQNTGQQTEESKQEPVQITMQNDRKEENGIFSVSRIEAVSFVWMFGSLGLVMYAVLSFLKLKRKVAGSIYMHDNIYLCDDLESPFVMGILKPRIYLSSGIPKEIWDSILKHENAHIKRKDHIWKVLGYALLVIYWFHPLVWISYILFCKDVELACDEKVTRGMDKHQRAEYCEALLTCSINRNKINVTPLAFGEVGVKERVKQILNYKKPSFWMMLLTVIVCVVVSVCFMTNPKSDREEEAMSETTEPALKLNSEMEGQEEAESVTEYDHIRPDIQGYRWLSDERNVYVYEFEDLDNNGEEEYAKVSQIDTEEEYLCRYIFYWNGKAIYEYENSYGMSPENAEYLDLDGDGEKEVFLTFLPHVNSMPLMEYIVLKQKTDLSWEPLEMIQGEEVYQNAFPISITRGGSEWEAVIRCGDLKKELIFDLAFYRSKLEEQWEKEETEENVYLKNLINDYKQGFPEESEWYTFGSVCAWGIWDIKSGKYQGNPCLIATHGIQGYDKFDFWGELDVYFDYDAQGNIKFLDMKFRY